VKLKILADAKNYVVMHKPSGFVTYADSPEQKNIGAKELLERQLKKKLFPVHRIDKDTCGVLVFAKSAAQAQTLTALFRSRVVKKRYLAIVHGQPPASGNINQPLERHKSKETEAAETEFRLFATVEVEMGGEQRQYSLVRCEPRTGRYHQVRRHLRSIGCPIIGDPDHGNTWDNEKFREKLGVKRTLLSATFVSFPDREAEKMIRVHSEPDGDFIHVLEAFGWKDALRLARA
jgi:tRNA pseudouridine65 synthase